MTELLIKVFGVGKDLNAWQMSCRGLVIFMIALVLVRISGRRSFGIHTPLDNIIGILLGAILSRAVVGASDFVPVVVCSLCIVLLHRLFGYFIATNKRFASIMEGEKIVVYQNGRFNNDHMRRGLICREDVMKGVRESASTEDLNQIETVYLERDGAISVIKKKPS